MNNVIKSESVLNWCKRAVPPPAPNGSSPSVSIVDLFCGCGGLTLGAWDAVRRSGRQLDIRMAVDFAEIPLRVFCDNNRTDVWRGRHADVGELINGQLGSRSTPTERYWKGRVGPLSLLVAGPPCQGHSDLNNSTRRKDPRNELYLRVIRAAEIFKPAALVIENVPTVIHDRQNVVGVSKEWLSTLGYTTVDSVVQVSSLGVPQLRKRHVLVATRVGAFDFELLPTSNEPATVGQFVAGLEDEPDIRDEPDFQPSRMSLDNLKRVGFLFEHDLFDLPNERRPECHRDRAHSYVSMYGRMHWDKPAQTITSGFGSMGQGRFVHPLRQRTLTPHEAARLQGFPDFFDFSDATGVTALREMIGNAVPPQLSAAIVAQLIESGVV